ncbi:hypothetical protein [Pseudomonas sp. EA_35y_Pfl2_R111]|uniref:hypothetical protein n=1 Tax=Pseudomonas sp. EA_35y_Pfl2_R111 TaxID=3088689 RepID=UPI0030D75678
MSNLQFAFINKNDVPTKESWQEAIDALGFKIKLELDPELKPLEDEGFCPCKLNEKDDDVGFEIYSEPAENFFENANNLKEIAGSRDFVIMFRWGSSMGDLACTMIACCALAKSFGAVISYGGEASYPDY